MLRQSLRVVTVVALAAAAFASPAVAGVTLVSECGNYPLDKPGETYVLTGDITAPFAITCFFVVADRVTLDLNGHTVTASFPGTIFLWDIDQGRTSLVVKNGTVMNFHSGILLRGSRTTARDVTLMGPEEKDPDNGSILIRVGPTSLVKDCIVKRSSREGIVVGDGSQVEGCVIGGTQDGDGNLHFGLFGGNRVLVTRNTVVGNGFGPVAGLPGTPQRANGIQVGSNSTVTFNSVSDNGLDGINVGAGSLVTRNTSSANDGDGIEAVCPSTITHNEAHGNGGVNFNPIGTGCFVQHNNFNDLE